MGENGPLASIDLAELVNQFWLTKASLLIKRAREIEERRDALGYPATDSAFAADDIGLQGIHEATNSESLSGASKMLACSAWFHLYETWTAVPTDTPGQREVRLNPFTVFTLLRASLEPLMLGLWLLKPDDSNQRLSRYAGLLIASRDEHHEAVVAQLKADSATELPERSDSMESALSRAGINPVGKPGSKELARKASNLPQVPNLTWTPLVAWQVASSVAHSYPWSMGEAVAGIRDSETNRITVRLNCKAFYFVLEATVELFDALVSRIEELNSGKSN